MFTKLQVVLTCFYKNRDVSSPWECVNRAESAA